MAEKTVKIFIQEDSLNKGKEQFKVYQRDFETVKVPIGIVSTVPQWVADIALRAGDITEIL